MKITPRPSKNRCKTHQLVYEQTASLAALEKKKLVLLKALLGHVLEMRKRWLVKHIYYAAAVMGAHQRELPLKLSDSREKVSSGAFRKRRSSTDFKSLKLPFTFFVFPRDSLIVHLHT